MEISKYINNNRLRVRVTAHSGRTELREDQGKLKLYLKAAPEDGKANLELVRYFKKNYGLSVRIKLGATNREKLLEIVG